MITTIVSANIASSLFLLIILVSIFVNTNKFDLVSRLFTWSVIANISGLIIDSLCYKVGGVIKNDLILFWVGILTFAMPDVIQSILSFHLVATIRQIKKCPYIVSIVVVLLSFIDIIKNFVGAFNGKLFRIENHSYVFGEWVKEAGIIPMICIILMFIVVIKYRRAMGLKSFLAFSSYFFIPTVCTIIQLINPSFEFTFVAIALVQSLIYSVVQARQISESNMREKILGELAYLDTLTGLGNRRYYEKSLEKASDTENIGTVFCDLNSLKYSNDHYGHVAGDELIIRFAKLLQQEFEDGDVCRISGDEFVVILRDIEKDEFENRVEKFNQIIYKNDRIASLGYAHGVNVDPVTLINTAEQMMYDDKEAYYKETGRERRK